GVARQAPRHGDGGAARDDALVRRGQAEGAGRREVRPRRLGEGLQADRGPRRRRQGGPRAVKKLINSPRTVVREMLEGLAELHPGLAILDSDNVILRAGLPPPAQRAVALLSGGGSGHEPAHAGYVGEGMLTAAVAGEVFTSPSVDAVLAAIRASAGSAGALL